MRRARHPLMPSCGVGLVAVDGHSLIVLLKQRVDAWELIGSEVDELVAVRVALFSSECAVES